MLGIKRREFITLLGGAVGLARFRERPGGRLGRVLAAPRPVSADLPKPLPGSLPRHQFFRFNKSITH
jgi:hypothetical protein